MFDFRKDLTGRLIAIDLTKCKKFSCGNFSVNMGNPAAIVMVNSQQEQIRQGLLDGRLIDISDQNKEGLVLKGAQHTKPILEDTGEKVFITIGANGSMSIAIPKDQQELQEFEQRIATDGVLILDSPEISSKPSPLKYGVVGEGDKDIYLKNFRLAASQIKRDS